MANSDATALLGIPKIDEAEAAIERSAFGQQLRAAREIAGVSVTTLAEVLALTPAAVRAIEAGEAGTGHARHTLYMFDVLGMNAGRWTFSSAVAELDAHASELGCWEPHSPLAGWARELLELDNRCDHLTGPTGAIRVPEELREQYAGPALGAVSLPELRGTARTRGRRARWAYPQDSTIDYTSDGRQLAALTRAHLGLPAGVPVTGQDLADALGVHVAAAPAPGSHVRSLTLRLAGGALVVLNSALHETVQHRALMHALGHLVAGDVLTTYLIDWIEDLDDDSIYCCSRTHYQTCHRASAFAATMLIPAEYVRALAQDCDWLAPLDGSDSAAGAPRDLSLRSVLRVVQDRASALRVPPALVLGALSGVAELPDSVLDDVRVAMHRRAPFGGSARNGGMGAVVHEDLTLGAGAGEFRMPAALRARVFTLMSAGAFFSAPAACRRIEADWSEMERAAVEMADAARSPDVRDYPGQFEARLRERAAAIAAATDESP